VGTFKKQGLMVHSEAPMSRTRLIAAWILQILLAALFLVQAWMKLSGSPNWITQFRHWGYPDHFYLLIGFD